MGDFDWDTIAFPPMDESASILVLHQTLKQLTDQTAQSVDVARIQDCAPSQFNCILSGHHHDAQQTTWRGVPLLYTGASEYMSTNTDPTDRVAWFLRIEHETVTCERYDIPNPEASASQANSLLERCAEWFD